MRLTLVVDESFADFRSGLNTEYADARGASWGSDETPEVDNVDDEIIVRRRPDKFASSEFAELWKSIRYKARYKIRLDPSVLPEAVAQSEHLEDVAYLARRANVVQTAELVYDDDGQVITQDNVIDESRGQALSIVGQRLPDPVRLVEDQLLATKFLLQLTRPTIAEIVAALPSRVIRRAIGDPDRWARIVAQAIRTTTIEEMVKHISYEPVSESDWWDAEVVFIEADPFTQTLVADGSDPSRGHITAPAGGSNLYDGTIYDSHVERAFAQFLENASDRVRLFTKLPRRFRVRTPVGEYSPDWAILYYEDGTQRLYLVRETKDTLDLSDLDWDESMRIPFARRHFDAAPLLKVDYMHTTDHDGLIIAMEMGMDQ